MVQERYQFGVVKFSLATSDSVLYTCKIVGWAYSSSRFNFQKQEDQLSKFKI